MIRRIGLWLLFFAVVSAYVGYVWTSDGRWSTTAWVMALAYLFADRS